MLCRKLSLFGTALVAIDGCKFKAVNTRDKNFTANKVKRRIEQVEAARSVKMRAIDTRVAEARRAQGVLILDRATERGELAASLDRAMTLDLISTPLTGAWS